MNTMISNPIFRTVAKPTNAFDLLFNDLPVRNLFSNQWKNNATCLRPMYAKQKKISCWS